MKPVALLLLLVLATPLFADSPRVGLVLSGGGARGLAHIGVIRALEEQNIHIAAIAGTSMGAIIGGLYASGRTPDELEAIALSINWAQTLDDLPPRDRLSYRRKQDARNNTIKAQVTINDGVISLPRGVIQGQNLQITLQNLFLHVSHITDFDSLAIPFRVVAGDLATGEAVVFSSGSLPTAVRASMSIPGLFSPVELDGRLLVDGGIANNLPVDVMRDMDVDHIIAVDIATPLYGPEELDSVIPIIEQLTTLLTFNQLKAQYELIRQDDLLVSPDLSDINTADFDKSELAISRGYEAMAANRDKLARYSSSREISRQKIEDFAPPVINGIEIQNNSTVSDKLILAQINQKAGHVLDEVQLRRDIATIYGYDYFESVQYNVASVEEGHVLQLTTTERAWGKDVLGVSFELFSETNAGSGYNIGASIRRTRITATGGEWFTSAQFGQDPAIQSELYLPLDYEQRFFVRPYGSYTQRTYNLVTDDNEITARFRIDKFIYGIFAGTEISNKAIAGFGIEHHNGDTKTFVGSDPERARFHDRLFYFLAEYDDLDNVAFPTDGGLARLRFDRAYSSSLVQDYNLASFQFTRAFPIDRHSFIVDGRYRYAGINRVNRHLQASLGGFKNLSGMHRDSLVGNNLLYLGLTYLHRLDRQSMLPVELPVYLGISLEAGNAWNDQSQNDIDELIYSGLLVLGVDTPVGPVYFGYGRSEAKDNAFYLRLGHLF